MREVHAWLQQAARTAAAANVVPMVLASARASIDENNAAVKKEAASRGVELYVRSVIPRVVDGSEKYPSVLTELLCAHPEKVGLTNDQLMQEVSALIGLNTALAGNRMSKKFSIRALEHVRSILSEHGYNGEEVQNGTDVKRTVKRGKQQAMDRCLNKAVSTEFLANGVILDGRKYQYRQRERSPMGNPWHDFCIRVSGVDVPLSSVLKLRKIGLQEFQDFDMLAIAHASPDDVAKRAAVARDNKPRKQFGPAAQPGHGFTVDQLAKAWYQICSKAGRRTGLRELVEFYQSIQHDSEALGAVAETIEAWEVA